MLSGRNIVVFDLEIKNVIGQNGVTWDTLDQMGISVGCLFDFKTLEYQVYMDDNLTELGERINQADLVVGFNILSFDLPLLSATLLHPSQEQPFRIRPNLAVYDILYWSRVSVGWNPDDPLSRFPSGLKLDDHLLGTFGPALMKTADGAQAPVFYQEKKLGRLISYCLADVNREAKLFKHIWGGLPVRTKTHGEKILKHPKDVLEEA